jgi:hypothetical protein
MKATIIIPNREPFPFTFDTDEFIHLQGGELSTYNNSPYPLVAENVDSFSVVVDEKTLFRILLFDREPFPLELDRQGNILFVNNTILLYNGSTYTVLAEGVTIGFEVEWL